MRLKVNEAIAKAKEKGAKLRIVDIATELWPNSRESAALMNFTNLRNGSVKHVDTDVIVKICDILGCDANYLFNIKKSRKNGRRK